MSPTPLSTHGSATHERPGFRFQLQLSLVPLSFCLTVCRRRRPGRQRDSCGSNKGGSPSLRVFVVGGPPFGSGQLSVTSSFGRSEERRVGKECRSRWWQDD